MLSPHWQDFLNEVSLLRTPHTAHECSAPREAHAAAGAGPIAPFKVSDSQCWIALSVFAASIAAKLEAVFPADRLHAAEKLKP